MVPAEARPAVDGDRRAADQAIGASLPRRRDEVAVVKSNRQVPEMDVGVGRAGRDAASIEAAGAGVVVLGDLDPTDVYVRHPGDVAEAVEQLGAPPGDSAAAGLVVDAVAAPPRRPGPPRRVAEPPIVAEVVRRSQLPGDVVGAVAVGVAVGGEPVAAAVRPGVGRRVAARPVIAPVRVATGPGVCLSHACQRRAEGDRDAGAAGCASNSHPGIVYRVARALTLLGPRHASR